MEGFQQHGTQTSIEAGQTYMNIYDFAQSLDVPRKVKRPAGASILTAVLLF